MPVITRISMVLNNYQSKTQRQLTRLTTSSIYSDREWTRLITGYPAIVRPALQILLGII
jgi:hypothetical protein